jgi:hypothetical protein
METLRALEIDIDIDTGFKFLFLFLFFKKGFLGDLRKRLER